MTDNSVDQNNAEKKVSPATSKKPNELGAIHVEGFVKIYDPKTKEVYLESRA